MWRLAFICAFLAGCSPVRGQLDRAKPAVPALHAIHDQRLRELMAAMDNLIVSEKEMTETQRDAQRREFNLKIAESAEAMAKNAASIRACLPKLKLSETEQATFLALADRLHGQALGIGNLAAENHSDSIPNELNRLSVTCRACHQLFRASGG